jgi:hypothetical protein
VAFNASRRCSRACVTYCGAPTSMR